jgi:hypothetical protein
MRFFLTDTVIQVEGLYVYNICRVTLVAAFHPFESEACRLNIK